MPLAKTMTRKFPTTTSPIKVSFAMKNSESVERFVSLFPADFQSDEATDTTSMRCIFGGAKLRVKLSSMFDRNASGIHIYIYFFFILCTCVCTYPTPSQVSEIEGLAAFHRLIKANDSCPPASQTLRYLDTLGTKSQNPPKKI